MESPARGTEDAGAVVPGAGFVAHVEPYDDAPDECTIYPVGVDDDELVTSWVTAEEGAFVAAASMR